MGTPTVTNPNASAGRRAPRSLFGDAEISHRKFTFSTSYATGGEAFDPAASSFDIGTIIAVQIMPKGGWTFEWDATNKKIKAYTTAAAEVAAAANLSVTPGALDVFIYHR